MFFKILIILYKIFIKIKNDIIDYKTVLHDDVNNIDKVSNIIDDINLLNNIIKDDINNYYDDLEMYIFLNNYDISNIIDDDNYKQLYIAGLYTAILKYEMLNKEDRKKIIKIFRLKCYKSI